jgi:hypothetical protein
MHTVVTLQSAHHAREGSSQHDQEDRLGTNEIQLSDEFMEAKRGPYQPDETPAQKYQDPAYIFE